MKIDFPIRAELGRNCVVMKNDLSRLGLRRVNLLFGGERPNWKELLAELAAWGTEAQGWYRPEPGLGAAKLFTIWYPAGEVVELEGKHPGVMWYAEKGSSLAEAALQAVFRFELETGRKAVRILNGGILREVTAISGLSTSVEESLPWRIVAAI